MKRVMRHRIFLKYLLTYLVTLLLPTLLLMAFVYQGFVERLQDEVVAGSINTLDKSRAALDEQMKRVEELTNQMVIEQNRLSPYRVSQHLGYRSWGIVEELKRYAAVHAFVHEIWLYYRGEDTIYTSSSVYRLPMLVDQVYPFSGWHRSQMIADLNESRQTRLIPPSSLPGELERYLQIVVPVLPNQSEPYATLVYLIKESAVRQLLLNHYHTGGSTWIFDEGYQLLTGVGPQQDKLSAQVGELLQTRDQVDSYEQVSFDGEPYYLFVLASPRNGWNYVTLLPVAQVMDSVQQAKHRSLYGMAVILLAGGLIVFYSMRWNYRPIRQLKLASEKLLADPVQSAPALNELETVQYAMQSLMSRNRELDDRIRSQTALVKRQWLFSLLRGQVDNVEDLQVFGRETGFFIAGDRFRVAIIKWARHSTFAQHVTAEQVEAHIVPPFIGYGVEHPDPGRFILLLVAGDEERILLDGLDALHQQLRKEAGESVTLGIGTACSVADIPRSYLEADTALSHRFVHGTDRLIDFADIPKATTTEHYPQREMRLLQQAIRNGQADQVEAHLRAMICFIREQHPSLFAARGLCLDMIRTVNAAWEEMELDDSNLHRYPDVFSLESIETLDAFEQLIQEICRDLCQLMGRSAPENNGERSLEAMKRYIHEHYHDCEFSFQSMAIHFGMALSNLSQLFKDQSGSTLLDYTTDLRMEQAKARLLASADTLKTVAESVGYYNVSSFIRRFKKWTGSTPGEYRQKHVKEEMDNG